MRTLFIVAAILIGGMSGCDRSGDDAPASPNEASSESEPTSEGATDDEESAIDEATDDETTDHEATDEGATGDDSMLDDPPPEDPMPVGDPDPIELEGDLVFNELPRTKSVEAFLGREFVLTDEAGEAHNLKASDSVSREDLRVLAGQTVTVSCVPFPPSQPDPMAPAPTDIDGNPLERPGGCSVTRIATK